MAAGTASKVSDDFGIYSDRNKAMAFALFKRLSLDPNKYSSGSIESSDITSLFSNILHLSDHQVPLSNEQEIMKWVTFASSFPNDGDACLPALEHLNEDLNLKSVLLGNGLKPSEADIVVFSAVHSCVSHLDNTAVQKFPNVIRWMDYIQDKEDFGGVFAKIMVDKPEFIPIEIAKKKNSGDNKANGPSGKDSGANEKKKKTLEKETAEKDAESNISILNIQIAIIRKASKHPSADSLLVEEIDLGDGNLRQVVSGLAKFYSPEDLVNRRVVLVTNVKPGKLRDIMSAGLLAICNEKKSSHDFDKSTENVNQIYHEKVNAAAYPSKSVKDKNDSHPRTFRHQDSELSSSSSEKLTNTEEYPNSQTTNLLRKGSAGVVGSMMLLCSCQKMHAPYTQDPPIMTEDMHEERLRAVEASGDAFSFSGQLERDILSSDMSAFKAANPDAVFEDFIRWHSPGDWEDNKMKGSAGQPNDWPPRGKLSQRMSEHGNLWRQIWNASPPLPVSEQKPLLDPIREGEKILHYLETLKPYHLLEQMVCTAFRASADILNQTSYGDFKPMKTKFDQLYLTIASNLKCFQANHLLEKDELIGDLRRLCLVFEHIEKLLILAASIHRKLLDAPRLSEAVFNDYFAFYLPKMGNSLESMCYDQEFKTKQLIMPHERNAVASLFPPPTANQSWRKVLSMGNLLNGHEPILREIIFSINDRIQDSHYASGIPTSSMEEIQTHRMYICGTSNDLWVALSVTSWD